MSEDARYRTSTQYRHWSYTPSALHALRKSTNELAAIRVRAAVRRVREVRAASSAENSQTENGRSNSAVPLDGEVECLTVEEELKLLTHFCRQLLDMGEFMGIPTGVKVCFDFVFHGSSADIGSTGDSYTIPQTILPHKQHHDLRT